MTRQTDRLIYITKSNKDPMKTFPSLQSLIMPFFGLSVNINQALFGTVST